MTKTKTKRAEVMRFPSYATLSDIEDFVTTIRGLEGTVMVDHEAQEKVRRKVRYIMTYTYADLETISTAMFCSKIDEETRLSLIEEYKRAYCQLFSMDVRN